MRLWRFHLLQRMSIAYLRVCTRNRCRTACPDSYASIHEESTLAFVDNDAPDEIRDTGGGMYPVYHWGRSDDSDAYGPTVLTRVSLRCPSVI